MCTVAASYSLVPKSIDILCFPEMIFSGYMFPDSQSISRYLEEPKTGPTSRLCSELASRLQCYVTAGYPERLSTEEAEGSKIGANSAVLCGPKGEWIGGFRKTNLFRTDLIWAKAGTGFTTFTLPPPLNTVSFGICNDLNINGLTEWSLEDGPYEIADYCISQKSDLLILLDAWLDSDKASTDESDWSNINYWAARLRPLWVDPTAGGGISGEENAPKGKETLVVICNRFGHENGETFAGTSCLLRMRRRSGRPQLLELMGRREEGVGIWTVSR
ncbi:hypothetical protein HWV62_37077 [Athelia sp. TMB]|nr:hypothetical protein HWV62_37077 [Athelia sp. TMB]